MKTLVISFFMALCVLALIALCTLRPGNSCKEVYMPLDSVWQYPTLPVVTASAPASIYDSLAADLGIEVASMLAVSSIESGASHKAFISTGSPVVNLDVAIFKESLHECGYNVDSLIKTVPDAFKRPSKSRYANPLKAQRAMYRAASAIDDSLAKVCTYWGMYQIRGSNWKLCGASSLNDFVERMSASEDAQHILFAHYLKETGLDEYLRAKDWERFARAYNGEGYARHAYHTRLAEAYNRYKGK